MWWKISYSVAVVPNVKRNSNKVVSYGAIASGCSVTYFTLLLVKCHWKERPEARYAETRHFGVINDLHSSPL